MATDNPDVQEAVQLLDEKNVALATLMSSLDQLAFDWIWEVERLRSLFASSCSSFSLVLAPKREIRL